MRDTPCVVTHMSLQARQTGQMFARSFLERCKYAFNDRSYFLRKFVKTKSARTKTCLFAGPLNGKQRTAHRAGTPTEPRPPPSSVLVRLCTSLNARAEGSREIFLSFFCSPHVSRSRLFILDEFHRRTHSDVKTKIVVEQFRESNFH